MIKKDEEELKMQLFLIMSEAPQIIPKKPVIHLPLFEPGSKPVLSRARLVTLSKYH